MKLSVIIGIATNVIANGSPFGVATAPKKKLPRISQRQAARSLSPLNIPAKFMVTKMRGNRNPTPKNKVKWRKKLK
jgi:hypothetical protein